MPAIDDDLYRDSPEAPGRKAPAPDGEYRHNVHDLLVMVRSLMAFRVEALGASGAEFCAYEHSAAARRPLAVTDEDQGDHGRVLRIRLDGTAAAAPEPRPGRLARVEVKGFRDLGIVRVTETTLAGEAMLHAEKDDGTSADFPASSLHFITWLPEGAQETTRAMLPPGRGGFDPEYELSDDDLDDADETEGPF
jgi:hypothetical protein